MPLIETIDLAWEPEIWAGAGLSFETGINSYYVQTPYVLSNLHENPMEEIKFPPFYRGGNRLRVHK